MSDRDGTRIAVFGKSRSGKTAYTIEAIKDAPRVLAFDPKGSWLKKPGFEILRHASEVQPFLNDMGDAAFKAVYMPEAHLVPQRLSMVSKLVMAHQHAYFWDRGGAKITFAVDELAASYPLHLPGGLTGFQAVCQQGGEYGINVIGIAQSPSSVHESFRQNLDGVISFRFSFVNDKKAVARAMEDEAVFEVLGNLEKYEFVECFDGKWERRAPLKL